MNASIGAVGALILAAAAANAQSFEHVGSSVTLAFNFHNDGSDEPYDENFTTQISLRSTYAITGAFRTTFVLGFNEETYQDEFYSNRWFAGIEPEYDFGAVALGGYLITGGHAGSGGGVFSEAQYGLTAGYEAGPWMAEAYLGKYEADDDDLETLGIAGGYGFANGLSLYGFHRRDSGDGDDWFGLTGVGAGFAFDAVPVDLTAEVSRFTDEDESFGESDWDQVSLMATYRFGAPKRSVFRGIYNVDYYYD